MNPIEKTIGNETFSYTQYYRRKSNGGRRLITAPDEVLKGYQREFADFFYERVKYSFTTEVTGFMPGLSIKDNAELHTNKDWVVNIDIKSFFPSVKKNGVLGCLAKAGISNFKHFDQRDLAEVLTLDGALPQGSPASPILANYIGMYLIDPRVKEKLDLHLSEFEIAYTRYADDITFSFNGEIERVRLRELIDDISHDLETNTPFRIAKDKIHVRSKSQRQAVTGIVVNEGFSINKQERNRLRAVMHKVRLGAIELDSKIRGKLNFVREINPSLFQKLTQGVEL